MPRHHFIYIPGLADKFNRRFGQGILISFWRLHHMHPHYFTVGWADATESAEHKLERLIKLIDLLHAKGHYVSLLCASAGSSMAMPAFAKRSQKITSVVCIAPAFQAPSTVPESMFTLHPTFKATLKAQQDALPLISSKDRQRILVIKPTADKVIAIGDMNLPGSQTITVPTKGHLRTIVTALTLRKRPLIAFMQHWVKQGTSQN